MHSFTHVLVLPVPVTTSNKTGSGFSFDVFLLNVECDLGQVVTKILGPLQQQLNSVCHHDISITRDISSRDF
jgi:hypothetical protein